MSTAAATTTTLGRDARVISLIGVAHGLSHFYQLVLAPLFPFIKSEFDVSYAQLGLLMGVFFTVSGVCQFAAGFAVDRFGATRVLILGCVLLAGGTVLCGLAPGYWTLLPVMAIMGAGNSVFHPADFAIMNASVSPRRLGHAYSTHGIGGNLGWALAPVASFGLAELYGWRASLLILGGIGLALLVILIQQRGVLRSERAGSAERGSPALAGRQVFLQRPVVLCFIYFCLLALAMTGIQTFGPTAINALHGTSIAVATGMLTGYMLGGACGILVGGYLATLTQRHDRVAMLGMAAAAAFMFTLAAPLPQWAILPVMVLSGFSMGIVNPSRDLIVRAATPRGAAGRVYGFVYSGLDLGALASPLWFGALLDRGLPHWVFVLIAACMALTILTVFQVRRAMHAAA